MAKTLEKAITLPLLERYHGRARGEFASKDELDGIDFSGKMPLVMCGDCNSSLGSRYKSVTIPGFEFVDGALVAVRFTSGNSDASPRLNINGTGDKRINWIGKPSGIYPYLNANSLVLLRCNGIYYDVLSVDAPSGGNSYFAMCDTAEKTGQKSLRTTSVDTYQFGLKNGDLLTVLFTYANTADAVSMYMPNNGQATSVPIYIGSQVTSAENPLTWDAGSVLTFVYRYMNEYSYGLYFVSSGCPSDIEVEQVLGASSGTEIAKVNGTSIYAPPAYLTVADLPKTQEESE